MDEPTLIQRSRILSTWLRHKPERGGLTLSPEGWAAISDILEAFQRQGHDVGRAEFDDIVRQDAKGRYEVQNDRVRARYGHSIELEAKPHAGMPPATLYHGTPRRHVQRIIEQGLKPMKRQFVHLSPDKKTAREVGRRRDQEPAIVQVAAHQAHEAGIQFYPRGKGIWLSDPIPPNFLSLAEEAPSAGRAAGPPAKSPRQLAPGTPRRRRPKGGFTKR